MNLDMYKGQLVRLRADYDVAFRALCRAISESQSCEPQTAEAKSKVDTARALCNRARNALAAVLLDRKLEAASKAGSSKRGRVVLV